MSTRAGARPAVFLLAALATGGAAIAQTSTNYKLAEFAFNDGGNPANGSVAASLSYKLSLDAVGDTVAATALTSAGNRMDAGFVSNYPPPGEVKGDLFASKTNYTWSAEKSIGSYDVYRGAISSLSGLAYGTCLQNGLTTESVTDAATPAAGQGFFYLVTARNRLGEIGTKGFATSGLERANTAPCP